MTARPNAKASRSTCDSRWSVCGEQGWLSGDAWQCDGSDLGGFRAGCHSSVLEPAGLVFDASVNRVCGMVTRVLAPSPNNAESPSSEKASEDSAVQGQQASAGATEGRHRVNNNSKHCAAASGESKLGQSVKTERGIKPATQL